MWSCVSCGGSFFLWSGCGLSCGSHCLCRGGEEEEKEDETFPNAPNSKKRQSFQVVSFFNFPFMSLFSSFKLKHYNFIFSKKKTVKNMKIHTLKKIFFQKNI